MAWKRSSVRARSGPPQDAPQASACGVVVGFTRRRSPAASHQHRRSGQRDHERHQYRLRHDLGEHGDLRQHELTDGVERHRQVLGEAESTLAKQNPGDAGTRWSSFGVTRAEQVC